MCFNQTELADSSKQPPRIRRRTKSTATTASKSKTMTQRIKCGRLLALSSILAYGLVGSAFAFSPRFQSPLVPSLQKVLRPRTEPTSPALLSSLPDEKPSSSSSSSSTPSTSKIQEIKRKIKSKLNIGKRCEGPECEDTKRRREKWLGWMTAGTPRKADAIIMREAALLGGLPRSERYSSRDWWHNTVTLPSSSILRDVQGPVMAMSIWATIISLIHRILLKRNSPIAGHMCISSSPHSMMVSALGLLLVFRTNSAYQRFAEGRKIWEGIANSARDLSRMSKLYEDQIGKERRRRVQRLLAAFPYLLRYRIRPSSVKDGGQMRRYGDAATDDERDPKFSLFLYQDMATKENDFEAAKVASQEEMTGMSRRQKRDLYWVDKRTLPWRLLPGDAMEKCARAQNRPLWVCDRMAKELKDVPDQNGSIPFTNRERITLVNMVDKLSSSIGSCERIHQTVVPLNYARHALRALTIWMLSLPFALVKDLGLVTGPVLFIVSWMLFGVYEIGTRIEDPFQGTLRLSILCDQIRRDVLSDEILRDTAYTIDLPKNEEKEKGEKQFLADGEEDDDDDKNGGPKDKKHGDGLKNQKQMRINGAPESIMKKFDSLRLKKETMNQTRS